MDNASRKNDARPVAGASGKSDRTVYNIQALRALAAYLVVLVHEGDIARSFGFAHLFTEFGHAGVDLFFVISGFIMVYTTQLKRLRPQDFLLHRIARVVPLYWAVTFVVFAIAAVAPSLMGATAADPNQLAKSLFFIPFQKSNGLIQPVVFLGWTLNYEMFFYLVFSIGLALSGRLIGVMLATSILAALVGIGHVVSDKSVLAQFYTDPIILEFVFGMAIAAGLSKQPKASPSLPVAIAIMIIGACIAAFFIGRFYFPQINRALTFGIPAAVIVLTAVALEYRGLQLKNAAIQKLGDASYSIYLSHFFVTQAFAKLSDKLHLHGPVMMVLTMTVVICAVTAFGLAVHNHAEKPLTKFARRFLDTLSRPRIPAGSTTD